MRSDNGNKTPLYFQLKEQLKNDILNGTYNEGDLIPSERELQELFNISSTTIRRALNELVQDNYLERKPGKGTFVTLPKIKRNLRKVIGFTRNIIEMGMTPMTKVLDLKIMPANIYARERLGLKKGEKIYRLKRLRFANDTPMILEERYIRTDLCPNLEKLTITDSLWKIFEESYRLKPIRHLQDVKITTVSKEEAEFLELNGMDVAFLIHGITFIQDSIPLECEKTIYRSDKYDLTFEAELE